MAFDIINFNEFGENPLPETNIYIRVTLPRAHADSMVRSFLLSSKLTKTLALQ